MMPRLDGFGLLAALRGDERTRTIPVILVSARAGEEAAVEGIDAGADDYLVKPFSARELIARVSGCLALALARREVTEALEAANEKLAEAATAKSEFLASMSHELRTPLTAILGFTGTLLMELHGALTDEQTTQLRTVQANGKHLLSLINDLLDLARIESGRLDFEAEPVACAELLNEVASGLRPLAEEKEIALEVAVPVDEVVISSGRRFLQQILINLANNAVKFTDEGSVRLELTHARRNGGVATRFSVSDTGLGIQPQDQERLFEAFERSTSPASAEREGTGLGLAITQRLATALGGELAFESEYGKGSTFVLEFLDVEAPCPS
jgi:protein-histidine pros-kinase